jgi:hypothetical protein
MEIGTGGLEALPGFYCVCGPPPPSMKIQTLAAGGFMSTKIIDVGYAILSTRYILRRNRGCTTGGMPGTGSAATMGWPPQSASAHGKDRLDVVARASVGRQAARSRNMLSQSLDKGKRNDTF